MEDDQYRDLYKMSKYVYFQEIYAEWVCDSCFQYKDVPLIKFKP